MKRELLAVYVALAAIAISVLAGCPSRARRASDIPSANEIPAPNREAEAANAGPANASSGVSSPTPDAHPIPGDRWHPPDKSHAGDPQAACADRLKQLDLALLMYAQDYDEHYPPARNWCGALAKYTRSPDIFRCPAASQLEAGFGLNKLLAGKTMSEIASPSGLTSLFETNAGKRNFAGDAADLAKPPRHDGGNNFAFADGHVRWYEPDAVQASFWRP